MGGCGWCGVSHCEALYCILIFECPFCAAAICVLFKHSMLPADCRGTRMIPLRSKCVALRNDDVTGLPQRKNEFSFV